ncbi:hypothetical protein D9757_010110 [Collybiopsis confluens]|uniref:Uncharacterized protein n=1 Tax=Collybiopsis confluens TaxID=2823264 RepID=A0A8H5LRH0_9AGAR|nr:hypothetical protein D9757_010110 [Collybiopsis confluens]
MPATTPNSELREFFCALHPTRTSSPSSVSSGSTLALDEDEIQSIFDLDKESYDFESQLPQSIREMLDDMLDEPDPYDTRFGKELNPQAAPFIPSADLSKPSRAPLPSIIRARVLAESVRPSFPALPKPTPTPSWIAIFRSGSTALPTNSTILAERATELAHSNYWHATALAELAQHFCWKASAADSDVIRETMAPFAWQVYRALWDAFSQDTALSFVWHLRESLLGTFKGCWSASDSAKAISYHFTPSEEYVASANWLAAFIGSLFTFDLIHVQHIKWCLSILVHELSSLEHITAISTLIEHAGPELWCYPGGVTDPSPRVTVEPSLEMIHLFLTSFVPKTLNLGNGSSVLARTVTAGTSERDLKVQKIIDLLGYWCTELEE